MAARVVKEIELGFVETPEDQDLQQLTSSRFPSKVGGKPAWLDPVHLPSLEDLACGSCGKPTTFLLQIYAPVPVDETDPQGEECHRTLFVFMCRDPDCHGPGTSKCFKVLRCQLNGGNEPNYCQNEEPSDKSMCSGMSSLSLNTAQSKDNTSNSSTLCIDQCNSIDNEHSTAQPTTTNSAHNGPCISHLENTPSPHLCIVCGCCGPKKCGRCTRVYYCSREHQVHDWKAGHKHVCQDLTSGKASIDELNYSPSGGILLTEYEIVTELEPDLTSLWNGKQERSEEERMADYHKFIQSGKGKGVESGKGGAGELSAKALKDAALSEHNTDKQFRAFKKRVAIEPEQVSSVCCVCVCVCGEI